MELTVGQALEFSVLGIAIVFVMIIFLMIIVKIMTGIIHGLDRGKQNAAGSKQAAAPAAAAAAPVLQLTGEPAPGSAGDVKLYNVSDRDAAMIMAIVADKMQVPLNELRFISIREVEQDEV